MKKRSPEELERLKAALKASSQQDRRDPAGRARGLDRLLEAEAAAPLPPARAGNGPKVAGVAVIIAAILAAWWLRSGASVPETTQVQVLPPAVVVIDAGTPAVSSPVVVLPVPDPPPSEPGPPAPTKVKPVPREVVEDPDLLERELALLDSARQELRTSPERALTILETWRREFPRGTLVVEASLVRVEALLKLGRRDEAEKLARKLIAADSQRDGLVSRRLGRLLDGGSD